MADKYYVGDVGTDIILDCEETIIGATDRKIKYKKPDGTIGEWDAEIYDDPESEYTNSCLKYITIVGDFNQKGLYSVQVNLTLGTWSGSGETADFNVYDPFG